MGQSLKSGIERFFELSPDLESRCLEKSVLRPYRTCKMNCYSVTYQLTQDRNIYEFSYRDEWIEASNETEVRDILSKRYKTDLILIKSVKLTGSWAEFQRDLNRSFQGD